jgi:AAA family ATP:ADP antiporter
LAGALQTPATVQIRHAEQPGSGIARWVQAIVPVKRGEGLTVALLALNCFILLLCYYVLKVVREPLILLGGGAELKSYASAGQTVLLLGVVPAFSWLSGRVSRIRLMTTMQVIFIGCLVGFYVLARAKAPIGLAFYIWLGIFNALVVSNFWSFANDIYTESEGKRVFAVIGIGASIGAIAGAFLPHLLFKSLGFDGLMMLAVVGLGASIVLYQIVDRRENARRDAGAQQEQAKKAEAKKAAAADGGDKRGGFTLVIRDRYLRLLALMLLVATVINTTGEYVISKMAQDHSKAYAEAKVRRDQASSPTAETMPTAQNGAKAPPPDAPKVDKADDPMKAAENEYLSNFFSSYYFVVNIISALLQMFVVARILTVIGMRKALFIMPVIVLGGWLATIMFISLTMIRIEKTSENSLDYSLHNTLRQALFLPTSAEAKYKAKAAIDTFFFRMGDVVASLGIVFLFVEVLGLGVRSFAVMNVILGGVWLVLAYRTGKLHDQLLADHPDREAKPAA